MLKNKIEKFVQDTLKKQKYLDLYNLRKNIKF